VVFGGEILHAKPKVADSGAHHLNGLDKITFKFYYNKEQEIFVVREVKHGVFCYIVDHCFSFKELINNLIYLRNAGIRRVYIMFILEH